MKRTTPSLRARPWVFTIVGTSEALVMAGDLVQISVLLFVSVSSTALLYILSHRRAAPVRNLAVVPIAARPRRR